MRAGFLLQPRWVVLTAGVVLFAVACVTLLAPWQFRRDAERRQQNDAVQASLSTPPVPIEAVPADATAAQEWHQVRLTGSYLPDAEVVARLRTVLGEPAFEVLTPLRLTSGEVVLVDRGFVRPASGAPGSRGGGRGNQVPDYTPPPAGEQTLVGRLRTDEQDSRPVVTDGGRRQVYAINAATVGAATGLSIRPGYVQLNADQPGVLQALPLPQLDAGPHLAYALQWLAFGAMALVGWVLLVRRELTEGSPRAAGRDHQTVDSDR